MQIYDTIRYDTCPGSYQPELLTPSCIGVPWLWRARDSLPESLARGADASSYIRIPEPGLQVDDMTVREV